MAVAACSGGGDGGDGGPTPTPTAFVPVGCQIVWINRDPPGQSDVIDYYLVDGPASVWTTGTHAYQQGDPTGATNLTGAFVDDYHLPSGAIGQAMVATAGTFLLTVESVGVTGSAVAFDDDTAQAYYLIDSAGNLAASQGTSGTGSFAGVWSAPDDPDVTEGSGTVEVLFQGTNLTVGQTSTYALCYDAGSSFAPLSREARIREAGARAAAILAGRAD